MSCFIQIYLELELTCAHTDRQTLTDSTTPYINVGAELIGV